ncbi:hypothetical protein SAMN05216315_1405 [Nitrosospira sp. Nsp18]|uniref:hypothetical protein n=1 Tax=Nitrosospira sp. Nsp18 TaxID=1855334 RepID=UPI000890E6AE|nr:hypothetical protein [Nitrosospira sp. Nsp18]SDA28857.1 hypothetical protein SAMN05216315_1405 [Nitrosospira sp. Nsp18]
MKIHLVICSIALLTTGCAYLDRQERRINYTETLDKDFGPPSLITDAKQRIIVNTMAKVGVNNFQYNEKGQYVGLVEDAVVKNHPSRIICAEPSPDVAQAISAAFTAAAKVDVKASEMKQASGSGSTGSSYVSSIAQLGERLATVQLLRDKMYRACEAYQNGAISDTSYTLMLARFDKTMASMLAAETAAGAFGRNLAALGGNASSNGIDPKKLADAQDAVKSASTKLQNASALPETDDAAKITKRTAVADASAKLNEAVANLAALEIQSATTAAQSGQLGAGSAGFGQITGRSAIAADAVARIHTSFLEDDASGTIIDACVVALDRRRTNPAVAEANQAVIDARHNVVEAEKAVNARSSNRGEASTPEEKALKSARANLEQAQKNLASQKLPLSLGDICATMLQNSNLNDNFLIRLQEEKHKRIEFESNLLIEQLKTQKAQADAESQAAVKAAEAKIAAAKSESEVVASLVKGCIESIRHSKKEDQAANYAACILIKPK